MKGISIGQELPRHFWLNCSQRPLSVHSFFLEVVFFLSCIGTASVWEDVSKAVSLTPSHKVSKLPPGEFYREIYQVASGKWRMKENQVPTGTLYLPSAQMRTSCRCLQA